MSLPGLDYRDPVIFKVWCGRRDEAHRTQKKGVRTPLTSIEQVETGTPITRVIPNNVAVPSVCKRVTVGYERFSLSFSPGSYLPTKIAALFDWEKGRRLWIRASGVNKYLKPSKKFARAMTALEYTHEELNPDIKKQLFLSQNVARRQHQNAYSVEPYPGHLRVTCPVCGTVYRLTLYGEVAEWLDEQVGKTRYVSAKHLEKLSLEMMGKNAE